MHTAFIRSILRAVLCIGILYITVMCVRGQWNMERSRATSNLQLLLLLLIEEFPRNHLKYRHRRQSVLAYYSEAETTFGMTCVTNICDSRWFS